MARNWSWAFKTSSSIGESREMHHAERRSNVTFGSMVILCALEIPSRKDTKDSEARLTQDRCDSTFETHRESEGVYR